MHATCTAVNDAGTLPVANRTTMTAPCTNEEPTVVRFDPRSILKEPEGGGVGVGVGLDGESLPLLQLPIHTAQTTATGAVRLPKNSLLSMV